jgi:hypothetical protein
VTQWVRAIDLCAEFFSDAAAPLLVHTTPIAATRSCGAQSDNEGVNDLL